MSGFNSERRNVSRVELISQAQCIKKQSGGKTVNCDPALDMVLLNVSENGLCLRTMEFLKKDDFIILDILLGDEAFTGVRGKVLWSMKDGDSQQYGVVVENMPGRLFSHAVILDNRTESRI